MKKKLSKSMLMTALIMSMCVSVANAAETEQKQEDAIQSFALDEYVVTAGRVEERLFDANANVNVITAEEIEKMHFQNVTEALKTVPGVQLTNYSGGGLNANMANPIRINGSDRVVILVDGVRMTPMGAPSGTINTNMINNMDNIERIEVLKGSAGVLYGSDAVGGVVNIITKEGEGLKTTLKTSGGNFGKENYHFSNQGGVNGFSWNVYYDKSKMGNFEDGRGIEWNNKNNSHGGGFSLSKKFDDRHKVSVKYNESTTDYGGDNPYNKYAKKFNRYQSQRGENNIQDTTFEYEYKFDDSTTNKIIYRTGRYFSKLQEEQYNAPYNNPYNPAWSTPASIMWGYAQGTGYKTETINNQFTKKFGDEHTLVAGFEFNKVRSATRQNHKYLSFAISPSYEYFKDLDSVHLTMTDTYKTKSYYIQDKWNITDKWNVTGGLRYDDGKHSHKGERFSYYTGGNVYGDPDTKANLSGDISKSLTIGHKFDDRNNLYFSYNDYFVLPSANDLAYASAGSMLDPSTGKNYNIGYNCAIDNNTLLSVNAFYKKADTGIGYVSSGASWYTENIYNYKDKGFDVQLDKRFDDKWSGFAGYTFLKHSSDRTDPNPDFGDTLRNGYLPRHTVNLGVNYSYDKWDIGLTARGFLSRDDGDSALKNVPASKGGWPDDHYWTADLSVNYKANKNIKVFATCNNLFDTYYVERPLQTQNRDYYPGAAYAMPGRSFLLGAEVSF